MLSRPGQWKRPHSNPANLAAVFAARDQCAEVGAGPLIEIYMEFAQ